MNELMENEENLEEEEFQKKKMWGKRNETSKNLKIFSKINKNNKKKNFLNQQNAMYMILAHLSNYNNKINGDLFHHLINFGIKLLDVKKN